MITPQTPTTTEEELVFVVPVRWLPFSENFREIVINQLSTFDMTKDWKKETKYKLEYTSWYWDNAKIVPIRTDIDTLTKHYEKILGKKDPDILQLKKFYRARVMKLNTVISFVS